MRQNDKYNDQWPLRPLSQKPRSRSDEKKQDNVKSVVDTIKLSSSFKINKTEDTLIKESLYGFPWSDGSYSCSKGPKLLVLSCCKMISIIG